MRRGLLSNTATSITVKLSGGATNEWHESDVYVVYDKHGNILTIEEDDVSTEAEGDDLTISKNTYQYTLICQEELDRWIAFGAGVEADEIVIDQEILPALRYLTASMILTNPDQSAKIYELYNREIEKLALLNKERMRV